MWRWVAIQARAPTLSSQAQCRVLCGFCTRKLLLAAWTVAIRFWSDEPDTAFPCALLSAHPTTYGSCRGRAAACVFARRAENSWTGRQWLARSRTLAEGLAEAAGVARRKGGWRDEVPHRHAVREHGCAGDVCGGSRFNRRDGSGEPGKVSQARRRHCLHS